MKKVKLFEEFVNEASVNLKANHLSSSDYQKAKKLKGFDAADWKWNGDTELYDKVTESIVNEAKDVTREELMDLMETKYGIKSVRNSEDFDGQTGGIWMAADNEEILSGSKIFDYYNKSAKYKNGVLKTLVDAVEKKGWWFSWNDPGTIMCWPKN